jgi:hypothetical protein
MKFTFVAIVSLGLWAACSTGPKVRTNSMSVEEHRTAAANDEAQALKSRQDYDPDATTTRGGGPMISEVYVNPTDGKLENARLLERHAAQHRASAAALEAFEDAQCQGVPPAQRDACPFLGGQVARVEDIPGGVKLVMAPGQDPQVLWRIIACHAAFGRADHKTDVDGCAPYVPMVTVLLSADGHGVELKTTTTANIAELRRRATAQVSPM